MMVAKYFASLGFKINNRELRKVDSALKRLETRLGKFGKKLDKTLALNIKVDHRKLNKALGNALDRASMAVSFDITRFHVNERALRAALWRASRRTGSLDDLRRRREEEDLRRREDDLRRREDERRRRDGDRTRGDRGGLRGSASTGGIAGFASRAYLPALAIAGGGYGLGQVNRMNQEVISAQLTTQAVTEAAGLKGQGPAAFDWLRNQGNRIGFSYMDTAQDYNNFLSNALGSGMGMGESQNTFLGFAEYGRAMGITPARQKLVLNAAAQMFGKGSVQSEELRRQMAESMPGTMSVFAEALQRMRGTSLTGQDSMQALYDTLKPGKNINTKEIAPFLAEVLREKAAPKLDIARKTSQAEQQRFRNQYADSAMIASSNGVESGFARIFKALTISLKESKPLVESIARGFDTVSKYASATLLSVQSITRFFDGRDSAIGDMLFPSEESKSKAFLFLESLKTTMTELGTLTDNIYNGWSMLLSMMGSSSVLDKFNTSLSIMANAAATFNKLASGDISGAMDAAKSAGKSYTNSITNVGRTGANLVLKGAQYGLAGLDPRVTMDQITPYQIPAPFDKGASEMDWATKYKAEQARAAAGAKNKYELPGINTPITGSALMDGAKIGKVDINLDVKIEAASAEDFSQKFQEKFKSAIAETLVQYSQTE